MATHTGVVDAADADRRAEFEELVRRQLELIGEDPSRSGLERTPHRVARSMAWLTRGYELDLKDAVGEGVFDDDHDNMIMVRDIELYSLCEHHMLPFFGKAHVAYIPNGRVLGLSKVPRIVDMFEAEISRPTDMGSTTPRSQQGH